MDLTKEFAAILADADALKGMLAQAGIPRHCHAAVRDLVARIEAMALAVAHLAADQTKPAAE